MTREPMTWEPVTWEPGPAWLFCPADRPERFAKAADRADVTIIDLEDAVARGAKAGARQALVHASGLDPARTVVRVNAAGTDDHSLDLAALESTDLRRVMLAKTEHGSDLESLATYDVITLIETPLGLFNLDEIVQVPNVIGLMWGADDLVAGLGGTSSRFEHGGFRDVARYARARTLIAAKSFGLLAIDAVHMDISDQDGLAIACRDAVAVGFDGTAAIHPTQVDIIRDAYLPSAERVDWAHRLLAAAEENPGVFTFEGRMVDGPIFAQARRIKRLAEQSNR
jgi:citrate lyase subunit beta/citryl-CoA lyase